MGVRFTLRFSLILLVSILLSVSNHFLVTSDYWSLQWGKTDWMESLVWKLAEYH